MQRPANPGIDPTVFWIAAVLSAAFVVWGILGTESLAAVFDAVLWSFLVPNFGWVFILSSFGFLAFAVYLAFSRYGKVRLGAQDERPEFSTVSWVAMMFSAGMGIGLMFFGVAEPLSHMGAPPFGLAEPNTKGAAQVAMQYTYFHWAFHPWAIYAIMGLALAYFTFRKGMPNLISTAFYPLLGDRVYGPIGKTIDILAIFATLFGSATSLGLGALQINQGLNAVFGIGGREAVGLAIVVIAVLTLAFVLSAISGVHRGIQWIANTNMVLAVFLLLFVFLLGPTVFILNTFTESLGAYLSNIIPMSFRTASYGDSDFVSGWTIFYWAWWISWAPFVGVFIARISRGRTIREFVVGVILAPSLVSFVWFAILGGSAIDLQLAGTANIAEIAANNQPAALFSTLQQFPLFWLMALVTIILVALFFVSGADAASVVMGMLSTGGNLSPRPWTLIVWGTFTGLAAAICLLAGAIQGSVDA
ncbi:MAG: BCCT family transporter, partial [Actinomycetota bacterium]|nr:BCCT family transporter [Actinomycetota bacterium]